MVSLFVLLGEIDNVSFTSTNCTLNIRFWLFSIVCSLTPWARNDNLLCCHLADRSSYLKRGRKPSIRGPVLSRSSRCHPLSVHFRHLHFRPNREAWKFGYLAWDASTRLALSTPLYTKMQKCENCWWHLEESLDRIYRSSYRGFLPLPLSGHRSTSNDRLLCCLSGTRVSETGKTDCLYCKMRKRTNPPK